MSKKATIIVEDLRSVNHNDTCFRVKQLKNTIEFSIGDYLHYDTVNNLCRNPLYDVQIVERKK
jgi:hypothetical protein